MRWDLTFALMYTLVYYDMQGCTYIVSAFLEYFVNRGTVILLLVEAIGESLFVMVKMIFSIMF